MLPRKSVLAVMFLFALAACASHAQTTAYTQLYPVSGAATTPTRIFDVPLTEGVNIQWLEYSVTGYPTACGIPANPATPGGIGFIFVENSAISPKVSPDAPCWNLSSANNSAVTFSGVADDGHPFDATFTFSYSTVRKCGGSGRGGTCKTVYTVSNGVLVVTKH